MAIPSVAAGLMAGHAVGSRLMGVRVVESAEHAEHAATHASSAPVAFGFLGALLLAGLAVLIRTLVKDRNGRAVSPWIFLVLPVVAWPAQEMIERLMHSEGFSLHAALDPGMLLGIAIQVPFGIAAFLVARLLFAVVLKVAASFTKRLPPLRRVRQSVRPPRLIAPAHRTRVVALRRAQRAPPQAA